MPRDLQPVCTLLLQPKISFYTNRILWHLNTSVEPAMKTEDYFTTEPH
jgi:isochorismate synthase EntC